MRCARERRDARGVVGDDGSIDRFGRGLVAVGRSSEESRRVMRAMMVMVSACIVRRALARAFNLSFGR